MKKTYMKPSMRNYRFETAPLLDASPTSLPIVEGQPTEWGAREDTFDDGWGDGWTDDAEY